jgi:hypothetical protein
MPQPNLLIGHQLHSVTELLGGEEGHKGAAQRRSPKPLDAWALLQRSQEHA